jgi:hypothetical protein
VMVAVEMLMATTVARPGFNPPAARFH